MAKHAKKLDHMEIREADGGGHVIEHHYEHRGSGGSYLGPGMMDREEHVFGKEEGNAALAHIAKHAGIEHTMVEKAEEHADDEGKEPAAEYADTACDARR